MRNKYVSISLLCPHSDSYNNVHSYYQNDPEQFILKENLHTLFVARQELPLLYNA